MSIMTWIWPSVGMRMVANSGVFFDHILEVCVPIMFGGDSFRKSTAADNLKTAARLLG